MKIESSVMFFPCKSMADTKAYYTQVLGLKIANETPNNLILDTNYGYIGFVEYDDGRPMATNICISFNCPTRADVDEAYAEICGKPECHVSSAPAHHAKFPVYSFFFSDPNGYTLEFQKLD